MRYGFLNLLMERQMLVEAGVPDAELDERVRDVVCSQFLPDDESQALDRLNEYAAVDVSHDIVSRHYPDDLKKIERFITHIAPRVGT